MTVHTPFVEPMPPPPPPAQQRTFGTWRAACSCGFRGIERGKREGAQREAIAHGRTPQTPPGV